MPKKSKTKGVIAPIIPMSKTNLVTDSVVFTKNDERILMFDRIMVIILLVIGLLLISFFIYLVVVLNKCGEAISAYNKVIDSVYCNSTDIINVVNSLNGCKGYLLFDGIISPLVDKAIIEINKKCPGYLPTTTPL
jgi:hypothetical protein